MLPGVEPGHLTSFDAAEERRTHHVVVLDAITGQVRSTFTSSATYSGDRVLLADQAIVLQDTREGALHAHPTTGDGPDWTWRPSADCVHHERVLPPPLVATGNTALGAVACETGSHWAVRYLTLDAGSGREVRRAELPSTNSGCSTCTPRSRRTALETSRRLLDPATGALNDAPKGNLRLRADGLALGYTSLSSRRWSSTRLRAPPRSPAGPVAACVPRGVPLADGAVCVYSEDDGWQSAFIETGHAPELAAGFGVSTLTSLLIDLGRPIPDTVHDHTLLFDFAATPGAIVVYTTAEAVADNRVVGLR
ncbi:hypothetical protein [Actinoplanes sp. NPDC026623]|uniref:hypothetical protein n=1 Tax=Actinoplanes sp. NPDC026623 TaxID=3155610 RepID=UPI0033DECECC